MIQRFKHIENTIIEVFDNTVVYIGLSKTCKVKYSEELSNNIIIDFDKNDHIIGVELLSLNNIPNIENIVIGKLIRDNEYDKLEKSLEFLKNYKNKF